MVVVLIVVGFAMYAVNYHVPLEPKIKQILNGVVTMAVVIWVLQVFGFWGFLVAITVRGHR
jgi:hypothetical protein